MQNLKFLISLVFILGILLCCDVAKNDEIPVEQYGSFSYNGNGNTGGNIPTTTKDVIIGEYIVVEGNWRYLSKENFDFLCWNTQPDGRGIDYKSGDSILISSPEVVLYAKWKEYDSFIVSFDSIEGSIVEDINVYKYQKIIKPENPTRKYSVFVGWYIDSSYWNKWDFENDRVNQDIKLYAKWEHWGAKGEAGGWIIYDKGFYENGWRYLEAAPTDLPVTKKWGTMSKNVPGASGMELGDGIQNTIDIINGDYVVGSAAESCDSYSITYNDTIYDDWFLPSYYEMYNIRKLRYHSELDHKLKASLYWTSTNRNDDTAFLICLEVGVTYSVGYWKKELEYYVRPVRAF